MIVDRLYEAVKEKGFVCVGLDSHLDYIPNYIKEKHEKLSDVIFEYNKRRWTRPRSWPVAAGPQ